MRPPHPAAPPRAGEGAPRTLVCDSLAERKGRPPSPSTRSPTPPYLWAPDRGGAGLYSPARTMPSFASIDVGSNASRLLIAEAEDPSGIRYVDGLRAPVRLGHSVFLTGKLDPRAIDECIEALARFREHLEQRPVTALRAVVTASARDAVNSDELLERAREEAGVPLEAINGTEEARLVKLAVESKLPLEGGRSLLVDLGGGSLELTEVHHGEVRHSTSLEIGTVRLLDSVPSLR